MLSKRLKALLGWTASLGPYLTSTTAPTAPSALSGNTHCTVLCYYTPLRAQAEVLNHHLHTQVIGSDQFPLRAAKLCFLA